MNELKQLGQTIAQLRIKQKIPRERFAFETELARSFIYRIEQGTGNPSIKSLIKIASELNCKVRDLIKF
ncbi:MAG: helix-turn-helix domain-containing protein [Candidatus Margulisbacteria bacterium]|jgi:transcriptional regulator with XRE-family HTH domain|nr:helix-turn-helix domain-containing protein [Candidatus Margulisiibacteriota bacterium]